MSKTPTPDQAAGVVRNYEYQIRDTPCFTVIDETWELVDIFPKPRSFGTIYLMVFRKELHEALSSNNGQELAREGDVNSFQKQYERGEIQP